MRITRLKIDNYGPVRDCDWDLKPGMNLFFGMNESGKTLLVESMVKLLLAGDTDDFTAIDRVTGNPAGFLVVENADGEIQIPDADYTDLFPPSTKGTDLRNAFVIRDLDLRLPERQPDFGHAGYLRDVTDRIMGSQTQKIESVKERIAELGNLANMESDRLMDRQPAKLKTRRDEADAVATRLRTYLDECRTRGILRLVRERRDVEDELESVKRDIRELELAKQQQKLETGRALIETFRTVEGQIEAHEARHDEIEEYRELRRQIKADRESPSVGRPDPAAYRRAAAIAIPLFALSLVAAIVSPVTGLGLVSAVLLLVILVIGVRYFAVRSELADQEQRIEAANFAGFEGDDLPTVYQAISGAIEDYEEDGRRLSAERSETVGNLKGAFEADHESLAKWEKVLGEFAAGIEAVDRAFDRDELDRLVARRETLEVSIDELRRELRDHRDRLSEFDSALQDVSPEDYLDDLDDVRIHSVEDLQEAIRVLDQFVTALNEQRDLARTAIELFEEIEEEEEQEINQLFTEDEFVVDTFAEVTSGTYTDVWYDEEAKTIGVSCVDGRRLTPFELSQGTYDLLYLTVRLKLASKLVGEECGFLVLDDAFIHSDTERTAKEIGILDQLADDGWQILYFSFRDAVKDAVSRSEHGTVIDLEPIQYSA